MKNLINRLQRDYQMIDFIATSKFYWSPSKQQIFFNKHYIDHDKGQWTLLHELGHAISGHTQYKYDIELLEMEVIAWQKAQDIAEAYNISISRNHVQNCLDTYRDWLHLRSTCPNCGTISYQISSFYYQCFNCDQLWKVSSSQLNRTYRLSVNKKTTLAHTEQVLFV